MVRERSRTSDEHPKTGGFFQTIYRNVTASATMFAGIHELLSTGELIEYGFICISLEEHDGFLPPLLIMAISFHRVCMWVAPVPISSLHLRYKPALLKERAPKPFPI